MSYNNEYPVGNGSNFTTAHAAGVIVIGSLLVLVLLRRGFRGLNVPGVGGVGIK